jgi:hypothetical protein
MNEDIGAETLALLSDATPVDRLTPTQLRAALTAARIEITAHTTKWGETEDTFGDDVQCTPGCHGSRLIPACAECTEEQWRTDLHLAFGDA